MKELGPETLCTSSRGAVWHMVSLEFTKSNDFLFWDAFLQYCGTIAQQGGKGLYGGVATF